MKVSLLARFRAAVVKFGGLGGTPIRPSWMGYSREPFAGAWQNGVEIDPIGSLTSFGAVFACISRISNDIAKLSPELLQMGANGIEVEAPATSPFWRPLTKPNRYQNPIQFQSYWVTSKLLFGNAYALKQRESSRGMVTSLHMLDPRRVTPMVTPEGDVYYSFGGSDLAGIPQGQIVPASEIIHDRGVTLWHPLVGVSPLYACALSATQGLRIQKNSATFFTNMSRPSGMLTAPGTIDDVTANRVKTEWEANYSAENIGRLAVMGDGLTYLPMTIPAETAQLIEQLDWTVADVARAFGVPLYKINAGPMPTNNNVEALELQYYTGCLQILIESMEACLTAGIEVTQGYCVELCLDGLARMDTAAQIESLAKAVGGAIMAPNEARAKRRLQPVPGGDSVFLQQQNFSLAALEKRDALPNPFVVDTPTSTPTPGGETPPAEDPAKSIEAMLKKLFSEEMRGFAEMQDAAREADRAEGLIAIKTAVAEHVSEAIAKDKPVEFSGEDIADSFVAGLAIAEV